MASGSRRNRLWMGLNLVALCVIVVLGFCGGSAAAKKGGQQTTSEKKLDHLASRGPVVTLADGNFTRYADGKTADTRPYHLVVLFTALSPKYKCVSCRMIEEPFLKVATAYSQQHDLRKAENRVVFARIDIEKGGTTFQAAGVQTAPRVFLVPQGYGFPTARNLGEFEVTQGMSRSDESVDDFLHDLGAITGAKVVILPDSSGLLPGALLLGVVLGFVAHFFADAPSRVLAVARHKGLWFAVSMGCYMIGVGGMIYCIIRNPKAHGFHQETGEAMLFSAGGRDQYWYEGVVVGVLYLFMSAAVLGIYFAAGWKRAPSLVRTAAVLACVTALCYLSCEYMALYVKKTAWYSMQDLLPPLVTQFHQGPLKRKHGLLKRLVRLSHLWLNEYTGFWSFCSKLKTLLLDYVVRRLTGPVSFK